MNEFGAAFAWLTDPSHWQGAGSIPTRIAEHLGVTALAVVLAALVAIPLGVLIGHTRRGSGLMGAFTGAARAIPTLGILTLFGLALGIGLGIAAALIYSVYIVVGGRVLRQEDPFAAATVVMLSAAAVFGLLVMGGAPRFPVTPAGWAAVLAIALVSTVIAMVGFFAGIKRLGAADAATLSTLEPVVTFVLAAVFLDEPVTLLQTAGGAIVLGAVIALARGDTQDQAKGSTSSR